MTTLFSRIIKDVTTEADGQSYDITRILFIGGVVCFLCLAAYDVIYLKHAFEGMNFGGGLGGLLGGGGAGVAIRGKMEGSAA